MLTKFIARLIKDRMKYLSPALNAANIRIAANKSALPTTPDTCKQTDLDQTLPQNLELSKKN